MSTTTLEPRRMVIALFVLQAALSFALAARLGFERKPMAFVALAMGFSYMGFLRAYQRGWGRALERVASPCERAGLALVEAEQGALEISAERDRLALFAELLDAVDQAIFVADGEGKAVYANRAAGGFVRDGAPLGRRLRDVLRLETEDGNSVSSSQAHEARGVLAVRADGNRVPVFVVERPLENTERTLVGSMTVCTDVSQVKRLEAELHHAQRLGGIGRLAGGVAHDFNNLLTVIGGAAAMAQRKLPADHRAAEDLGEIVLATGRAGDLTRQLLTFARKPVANKRPLELSTLVADMERMLGRVIGEHIQLTTSLSGEPLVVNADAGQLEQVLLNLVINARDAMPRGGKIQIVTGPMDREDGEKRYVKLEVVDSGTGVSDEVKARMFEPFFTTKPGERGTGLGLATCFGIVKQHDGRIEVASETGTGTGTRVAVLLPRTEAALEEPITAVRAVPRGSERVLLVEDDEAVRKVMAIALHEAGYRVAVAENGRRALELLSGPEKFDALVSDVVMPELGGPELAVLARRDHPELAIVLISGYADARFRKRPRALRGATFVQKPFSPGELIWAMKVAMVREDPRALRQA